jgi:hypothetical protein
MVGFISFLLVLQKVTLIFSIPSGSHELSPGTGDLARNGHAVFEREVDVPTDVGIHAKSQPQGKGYGVELLCIRRFCGQGIAPVAEVGKTGPG